MPDHEGLVREVVVLRWAQAKLRESAAEQWWCSHCHALRGCTDLEWVRRTEGPAGANGGEANVCRVCRVCGSSVEDLPF